MPKLISGKAADMNYRTSPHLPLGLQRKVAQWGQRFTASDPTLYGLPAPNHKFFEAHPTQSGELPLNIHQRPATHNITATAAANNRARITEVFLR